MIQAEQQSLNAPFETASFLRHATADAHARLESRLQWLQPPLSRGRFLQVVLRFYGFHLAWEKQIALHPALEQHVRARSRLPAIERDLVALGVPRAAFGGVERCTSGLAFLDCEAAAIGSCYVIEGSTLGGQIISRAIAGEPWAPAGGLRTFSPYGNETGAMWRSFRLWLDQTADGRDRAAMAAGARSTFVRLSDWLAA